MYAPVIVVTSPIIRGFLQPDSVVIIPSDYLNSCSRAGTLALIKAVNNVTTVRRTYKWKSKSLL